MTNGRMNGVSLPAQRSVSLRTSRLASVTQLTSVLRAFGSSSYILSPLPSVPSGSDERRKE